MPPVDRATRKSWLIWTTAVFVYFAALFHRTTLGVAGLEASERFGLGPAQLGVFTVLQIGVYALMQIPTGLLVDRYGPRRVLTVAALLMGTGQVLFAVADSYGLGLAARAVLGMGDAMTFISVIRLVATHFPPRQYSLVVAVTAAIGGVGNLVATVPLTLMLGSIGWTWAFLIAGGITALYSVVALLRVRDVPAGFVAPKPEVVPFRKIWPKVRQAWSVPGTRLGFWAHFSTMSTPAVIGLLWGYPYLVQAQGMSPRAASSTLGLLVIGAIVASPIIGGLFSRNPEWRMPISVGFLAFAFTGWGVLLLWPGGHVPTPVIAVVFLVLTVGGPISGVAFALARDYNPSHRQSTASGLVNVGGFLAVTVTALGVGVLLDLVEGLLSPQTAFRVAFSFCVLVLVLGSWRMLVWWRRARAAVFEAEERGETVPVQIRRRRWDALNVA
ncbi:MFS transporter [Lentzea albidocapillata]|uniref:Sugar phosphate permease n=1 Tax=Lentzea albidocapillata TaxID=40571 RepID=A0A1W2E2R0_9PSEU|nr:MFS transporter [Lentzea albidocapillata]SMD04060.1 Sugar phosphate permease [Lentzea albidocapillata]